MTEVTVCAPPGDYFMRQSPAMNLLYYPKPQKQNLKKFHNATDTNTGNTTGDMEK